MSEETRAAGAAGTAQCLRCQHYYITHHATFRYGCRALGFKSRTLPCREVVAASGESCHYFAAKPERRAPD